MSRLIYCVGAFPPPVTGYSVMFSSAVDVLKEFAQVRVYDVARRGRAGWFVKALVYLRACLALIFFERPDAVYVGINGGPGKIFDILIFFVASLVGAKVVIHHHSFSYINEKSFLMAFVEIFVKKEWVHIFLCREMEVKYQRLYHSSAACVVVSNAAFIPFERYNELPSNSTISDEIKIGFMSNLCEEKGLFEFVEIVSECHERNSSVKGVLAGPLGSVDSERFHEVLGGVSSFIEYIGPVYGEAKKNFFESIDIFIMPSKYKNEAQPVVLLESIKHGVPFLASPIGCCSEMNKDVSDVLGLNGLGVSPKVEDWVAALTPLFENVMASGVPRDRLVSVFSDARLKAEKTFKAIFDSQGAR